MDNLFIYLSSPVSTEIVRDRRKGKIEAIQENNQIKRRKRLIQDETDRPWNYAIQMNLLHSTIERDRWPKKWMWIILWKIPFGGLLFFFTQKKLRDYNLVDSSTSCFSCAFTFSMQHCDVFFLFSIHPLSLSHDFGKLLLQKIILDIRLSNQNNICLIKFCTSKLFSLFFKSY